MMDEAARARAAARGAVDDVVPPPLRSAIHERIDEAAPTPGTLTLLSARATGHDVVIADTARDHGQVGVQH